VRQGSRERLDAFYARRPQNLSRPNGELTDIGSDVDDGAEMASSEQIVVLYGRRDAVPQQITALSMARQPEQFTRAQSEQRNVQF
jgi:hypothetical protein